jgi:hypothetical protein
MEGFIESLAARARELDDADMLQSAEELRAAADAFDLYALSACLDRLRSPVESAAGSNGSTPP